MVQHLWNFLNTYKAEIVFIFSMVDDTTPPPYLGQTEAGLHADFVETLFLLQDVSQSQSGGRSRELFQRRDGLLLSKR